MDTRVKIDRNQFLELKDIEIYRQIIPESLAKISGKVGGGDKKLKERLINEMTQGQQSIFMFMIIYFHNVVGWHLFLYGFSTELKRGMFGRIKDGLKYLGDKDLLSNISQVEMRYKKLKEINPNQNLFEDVDIEYEKIKEKSFKIATQYINNHTNEFFIFEDI